MEAEFCYLTAGKYGDLSLVVVMCCQSRVIPLTLNCKAHEKKGNIITKAALILSALLEGLSPVGDCRCGHKTLLKFMPKEVYVPEVFTFPNRIKFSPLSVSFLLQLSF